MSGVDWAGIGRASTDLLGHLLANSELLGKAAARDFAKVRSDATVAYEATARDLRDVGATFRSTPRYLKVAAVSARIATRLRVAAARDERTGAGSLERAHKVSAAEILALCRELGGGVLKIGQLLSARADLLPSVYIEALSSLQDQAPAVPFAELRPIIEADLGASCEQVFASIAPEPIAAASLAQVHAATTIAGDDVVIKVRRPGIAALVAADIRALRILATLLSDSIPAIDAIATLREVGRFLDEELDFGLELERLQRFAAMAASDDRWHVPHVYPSLCGRRVITMERIHGVSLTEHLGSSEPAEVARTISLLIELLAGHVLRRGIAHGDPHPGNVMVEASGGLSGEDARIVFVDFGCVLELDEQARAALVSLVAAIMSRDETAIASALASAGFRATSPTALVDLAALFLEAFEPGKLAEIDPALQARRFLELSKDAGDVDVPSSFVLIARIFGLVGGLVLHHRPAIELAPLLVAALRR